MNYIRHNVVNITYS